MLIYLNNDIWEFIKQVHIDWQTVLTPEHSTLYYPFICSLFSYPCHCESLFQYVCILKRKKNLWYILFFYFKNSLGQKHYQYCQYFILFFPLLIIGSTFRSCESRVMNWLWHCWSTNVSKDVLGDTFSHDNW